MAKVGGLAVASVFAVGEGDREERVAVDDDLDDVVDDDAPLP